MLELDERTLADRLEETPELSGLLWKAYWGVKKGSNSPKVIGDINDAINRSGSCITTLVHGDYGTGKTSFMRLLQEKLKEEVHPKEESEKNDNPNQPDSIKDRTNDNKPNPPQKIHTLWLHMPGLTNHIDSSVVAVVVNAIVRELEKLIDEDNKYAGSKLSDDLSQLKNQLADLWRIESTSQKPEQE